MKKLVVLTTNRADFGLLCPVIKKLQNKEEIDVRVAVTGAHLSPEFGMTYHEIENSGIAIDRKIEILMSADTPSGISKSMGIAMLGFADYFEQLKPDAMLVLGDRYEVLAVCCAAMNARIPIIHLYGGETTEGAVDECVRHSITKMSLYHFTASEEFRRRVIQLGESPERVFTVGAMGPEIALHHKIIPLKELEEYLGFEIPERLVLCTYHPVTLEEGTSAKQIQEILSATEQFPEYFFLWTKCNSDADGRTINNAVHEYVKTHRNTALVDSLGSDRYLNLLHHAQFVLGNSSSGLSEVPSFGIPTVNVGDRQKGRTKGPSVIDCAAERESIVQAIQTVLSEEFRAIASKCINPYGDGNTSGKIADIIDELLKKQMNVKKSFYDMWDVKGASE